MHRGGSEAQHTLIAATASQQQNSSIWKENLSLPSTARRKRISMVELQEPLLKKHGHPEEPNPWRRRRRRPIACCCRQRCNGSSLCSSSSSSIIFIVILLLMTPSKAFYFQDTPQPMSRPTHEPRGTRTTSSRMYLSSKPRQHNEFPDDNGNNKDEDDTHRQRKNQYRRPKRPRKQQQDDNDTDDAMLERILQLEQLVAAQQVQIRQLQDKVEDWSSVMGSFADVLELMRKSANKNNEVLPPVTKTKVSEGVVPELDGIFATVPTTIHNAADAAGAAILAGLLAGKQRMLVDVRDAELSNPEMLVQFIELAVLPVAAGLEGLRSRRNRLKICFPTVSDLLMYRKSMALAAPDVVALSTLGFDPVEQKDNLVVIVAPAPDDEEGLSAMNELLSTSLNQPVVVLNHHMVPIAGDVVDEFEVAYHLRLLSVQYVAGGIEEDEAVDLPKNATAEEALEAAMQHAHQAGKHSGVTRAMVVRAYPRPWHVFVDTSPDTDADFSIAATFDAVPTAEEINQAIVECLEGSEEEDDIVKQQMQDALDSGQLDRVTDILWSMGLDKFEEDDDEEEGDDDDDIYRDMFGEDSV